jgi:hypothetical protein
MILMVCPCGACRNMFIDLRRWYEEENTWILQSLLYIWMICVHDFIKRLDVTAILMNPCIAKGLFQRCIKC